MKTVCKECGYIRGTHFFNLCEDCYTKMFEGVKPKVNDEEDFVLGSEVAVATEVHHNDVKYDKLEGEWVLNTSVGNINVYTVADSNVVNFSSIPQAKMVLSNVGEEILSINSKGEIEINGEVTEDYEKIGKAFMEWARQYRAN